MAPEAQQAASIGVLFVQVWPVANAIMGLKSASVQPALLQALMPRQ